MVTNEENTRRNERNLCGQVIQNGATKEGSALCPLGVGKGMQLVGWDPWKRGEFSHSMKELSA